MWKNGLFLGLVINNYLLWQETHQVVQVLEL